MCLDSINDFNDNEKIRKRIKRGIGWKVFSSTGKTYVTTDTKRKRIKRGKWTTDKNSYNLYINFNKLYKTGFHIFLYKKDAEEWAGDNDIILPVKFKNVVATGHQCVTNLFNTQFLETVVAKDIFVLKCVTNLFNNQFLETVVAKDIFVLK